MLASSQDTGVNSKQLHATADNRAEAASRAAAKRFMQLLETCGYLLDVASLRACIVITKVGLFSSNGISGSSACMPAAIQIAPSRIAARQGDRQALYAITIRLLSYVRMRRVKHCSERGMTWPYVLYPVWRHNEEIKTRHLLL